MRRPLALALGCPLGFVIGCAQPATPGPKFVDPPPTTPHATVLIATIHDQVFGTEADEKLLVEGTVMPVIQGGMTLRVLPGASRWSFGTSFAHQETHVRPGLVERVERELVPCAYHPLTSFACQPGYENVVKTHLGNVEQVDRVIDARCDAAGRYVLEAARRYRVTYHFHGPYSCDVACVELTGESEGVACRAAP
jgi:hypothetical protein